MITLLTVTLGREYYLRQLVRSIDRCFVNKTRHIIACQGIKLTDDTKQFINKSNQLTEIIEWDQNYGIGEALNKLLSKVESGIVIKLDDDCLIHSDNFDIHAKAVLSLVPDSVISPFPVGLINNLGGVQSQHREVKYSDITKTYYTLRKVSHVGGFARICNRETIGSFKFPYDFSNTSSGTEDTEFSSWIKSQGKNMYYLENAMVVEHQESTLGQHARYGASYFGKRF